MKIRHNPEKELSLLRRQKEMLEREINKCAVFAEGVKSDFWKEIEARFQMELSDIETHFETNDNLSENMTFLLIGKLRMVKKILSIKDFAKKRSILSQRYAQLVGRIKKAGSGGG